MTGQDRTSAGHPAWLVLAHTLSCLLGRSE